MPVIARIGRIGETMRFRITGIVADLKMFDASDISDAEYRPDYGRTNGPSTVTGRLRASARSELATVRHPLSIQTVSYPGRTWDRYDRSLGPCANPCGIGRAPCQSHRRSEGPRSIAIQANLHCGGERDHTGCRAWRIARGHARRRLGGDSGWLAILQREGVGGDNLISGLTPGIAFVAGTKAELLSTTGPSVELLFPGLTLIGELHRTV